MQMPRIGIITGVKIEEAALAPVMGSADAPYIRLSGARPTRARAGAEALTGLGLDGLLSFGSAGGVSPDVKPGDLLIAESVSGPGGHIYTADAGWTGRMSDVLGISPTRIAGMEHLADDKAKASLNDTSVTAIDMESHIVAAAAKDAGIPFAVLRAVVDPAGFTIPDYALDAVRPDGSVSFLPVISGLCMQPWTIGKLLDLNSYNKRAMESLSGAARALGPGFGLFTL
jgi:hypothetical protein